MQLLREDYTRKRIHNGYSVRIENSVTLDNFQYHKAFRVMLNSYPRDRVSISISQPLKILINL